MTAGVLAASGYFMGEELLPSTEANPKGYYESRVVEGINDKLVRGMLERTLLERILGREPMAPAQTKFIQANQWSRPTWLAIIPASKNPKATSRDNQEMASVIPDRPFCFKDPRFCYTLPAWRPHLPENTVFICVFRSPVVTALSILKEIPKRKYLRGMEMSFDQAIQLWVQMYQHVLYKHRHTGDWLFVHYAQIVSGEGLQSMANLVSRDINRSFPDSTLTRTTSDIPIPLHAQSVYFELCDLAGFDQKA